MFCQEPVRRCLQWAQKCRRHYKRTWTHGGRERIIFWYSLERQLKKGISPPTAVRFTDSGGTGGTHKAGGVVIFHCLCIPKGFQDGVGLKKLPLQLPLKTKETEKQTHLLQSTCAGFNILPLLTVTSPGCGSATTSRRDFHPSPHSQICSLLHPGVNVAGFLVVFFWVGFVY